MLPLSGERSITNVSTRFGFAFTVLNTSDVAVAVKAKIFAFSGIWVCRLGGHYTTA